MQNEDENSKKNSSKQAQRERERERGGRVRDIAREKERVKLLSGIITFVGPEQRSTMTAVIFRTQSATIAWP
jgi:hypothetical protein